MRGGGRQGGSQYQFVLITPNLAELRTWAQALEDRLKATPGIIDVSSDQDRAGPQVNVVIDRDGRGAAGRQHRRHRQRAEQCLSRSGRSRPSTPRATSTSVVLEIDPKLQTDPSLLDRIYVGAAGGGQVPLSAVARFERGTAPLAVRHQGQFPAATLSFNLPEGMALGDARESGAAGGARAAHAGGRAHRVRRQRAVAADSRWRRSRC